MRAHTPEELRECRLRDLREKLADPKQFTIAPHRDLLRWLLSEADAAAELRRELAELRTQARAELERLRRELAEARQREAVLDELAAPEAHLR